MSLHSSDKCGEIHTYHIYPLTIVVDRYGGTYSNGKITVWNEFTENIPTDIYSDDCTCHDFWNDIRHDGSYEYRKYHNKYGVGDSIQEAIDNLYNKLSPDKKMVEIHQDEWILEKFIIGGNYSGQI